MRLSGGRYDLALDPKPGVVGQPGRLRGGRTPQVDAGQLGVGGATDYDDVPRSTPCASLRTKPVTVIVRFVNAPVVS